MSLPTEADPDRQIPMPFAAADAYALDVMRWARELDSARAADGVASNMNVQRDVPYGPHRLHRYNVFSPTDSRSNARNAPVLVCWHGGGWTNGYRDYVTFMAPHVVAMGCVLVAPSYRLVGEARLPAAFDDSVLMLTHVVKHVAQWGGAPDRLILSGHSAGAHLAALVALRTADCQRAGVPDGAVRACMPVSGIMDLHHPAPLPGSLEERVYTLVLEDALQDAVMSPICWTAGNRVPFDLSCGEHDGERVRRSNRRMAVLLKCQPAPVSLHIAPGQDHFQTHTCLRDASDPWYQRLAGVIEAHAS